MNELSRYAKQSHAHPTRAQRCMYCPPGDGLRQRRTLRHSGSLSTVVFTVVLGLGAVGCKDTKKCDDAIATTRKAVELADFASARNWREHTWKVCGDRSTIDTLDKEILAAEEKVAMEMKAAEEQAQKLAQMKIDEAQKLWLKYDAFEDKDKTRDNLDKLLKRAQALGETLKPEHKSQLEAYNVKQHQRRVAELPSR